MMTIHLTDAATAFEPNDTTDRLSSVTQERLSALGLDSAAIKLFFGKRFVARHPDPEEPRSVEV